MKITIKKPEPKDISFKEAMVNLARDKFTLGTRFKNVRDVSNFTYEVANDDLDFQWCEIRGKEYLEIRYSNVWATVFDLDERRWCDIIDF